MGAGEADCIRKGHTGVPKGTNAFARMVGNAGQQIEPKQVEFYEPVTRDIIEISQVTRLEFGGGFITALPLGGAFGGFGRL